MAQSSDFVVDDGSGTLLLSQLNTMLPALASCNSGPTAPSAPVGGMLWLDTGTSPAVLRQRNNANTAWIALGPETVAATTIRGNSSGSAAAIGDISMATLKTMLGWSGSIVGNGWAITPIGLILQWGSTGAIAQGGGTAVTFPLTFPAACLHVIISPATSANNTSAFSVGARTLATTGFTATNNSGTSGSVAASYFAVGN